MQKPKKKKGMKYVRYPKGAYGKSIRLICSCCGEPWNINVNLNWKEVYTEEVVKNWQCWKCKRKNKWKKFLINNS